MLTVDGNPDRTPGGVHKRRYAGTLIPECEFTKDTISLLEFTAMMHRMGDYKIPLLGPVRKIVSVISPAAPGKRRRVALECGHDVSAPPSPKDRARCRHCKTPTLLGEWTPAHP